MTLTMWGPNPFDDDDPVLDEPLSPRVQRPSALTMPDTFFGKAWKIRDLGPPRWYAGSALYAVTPSVDAFPGGFYTGTRYVIAAYTPRAVDHGYPETTLFVGNRHGEPFCGLGLDNGAEILSPLQRVIGLNNHALAFGQIGYLVIPRPNRKRKRAIN